MPTFEYEVADPRGVLCRGRAEADSQGDLILRFREQGRLVVGVRPVGAGGLAGRGSRHSPRALADVAPPGRERGEPRDAPALHGPARRDARRAACTSSAS